MSETIDDRTDDRLASYPEPDEMTTEWFAVRDALRASLPVASLADRLLAEGIEGIACRAFHQGHERGFSLGVQSGYSDALACVDNERRDLSQRDGCFAACDRTLNDVAARIERMAK